MDMGLPKLKMPQFRVWQGQEMPQFLIYVTDAFYAILRYNLKKYSRSEIINYYFEVIMNSIFKSLPFVPCLFAYFLSFLFFFF